MCNKNNSQKVLTARLRSKKSGWSPRTGTTVRLIFFHWVAPSPETRQAVSFAADTRTTSISHSHSNDAIAAFQLRKGIDKNGIFFDPNIDSSSETTAGAYRIPLICNAGSPN